ncbi:MAG: NAD(P)H-hydrate epimerase [Pseudomonadota bacterium]
MILTCEKEHIRLLEQQAIAEGISGDEMMLRAGKAALNCLQHHWPRAKSVAVFCGGGNNGGDGYVLARLARQAGLDVIVYALGDTDKLKDEAKHAYQACLEVGVDIQAFVADTPISADIIVDALLGIGVAGRMRPNYKRAISVINAANTPVLAIDLPSGLEADKGRVMDCAVKANKTITFIALKTGLMTEEGKQYAGEVIYNDLDLPTLK